jgi:hypothetical protein
MKKEILDIAARLQLGKLSEYEAKWELETVFRNINEGEKFDVEDKLEVIKESGDHKFTIGQIVQVFNTDMGDPEGRIYSCYSKVDCLMQWLRQDEVRLVKE